MRQFSLLQYDIPERRGQQRIPNPSPRLRRFAIRSSYSVWIVPSDRIPWPLLNSWEEQGVRWHLAPFAADEAGLKAVLTLATDALRRQVEAIQASAKKSLAKAAQKHGEKTDGLEKDERRIVRRAERLLADAESAARAFGIEGGTLGLGAALTGVRALATANQERAALYADMAQQVKDPGMKAAALEGEVPVGILADFIAEESDEDMGHVVAAFRDPPAA
jgi:hypothetical protein